MIELPKRNYKHLFIGVGIVILYLWAAQGTGLNPVSIVKGMPYLYDFLSRLFPPDLSIIGVTTWKIVETLQMALIGSLIGALFALPLSFLAARNITHNKFVYQSVRCLFDFLRGIHEMVWALIFVSMVGLGPFPGVLALATHVTGALGRYFSEAIETIDDRITDAIVSTGASKLQVIIRGVFPQIKPLVFSYYLYYLESNFRSATILGLVGAGGIGMALITSIRLFKYHELLTILIMMVGTIIIMDRISAYIRKKIMKI